MLQLLKGPYIGHISGDRCKKALTGFERKPSLLQGMCSTAVLQCCPGSLENKNGLNGKTKSIEIFHLSFCQTFPLIVLIFFCPSYLAYHETVFVDFSS